MTTDNFDIASNFYNENKEKLLKKFLIDYPYSLEVQEFDFEDRSEAQVVVFFEDKKTKNTIGSAVYQGSDMNGNNPNQMHHRNSGADEGLIELRKQLVSDEEYSNLHAKGEVHEFYYVDQFIDDICAHIFHIENVNELFIQNFIYIVKENNQFIRNDWIHSYETIEEAEQYINENYDDEDRHALTIESIAERELAVINTIYTYSINHNDFDNRVKEFYSDTHSESKKFVIRQLCQFTDDNSQIEKDYFNYLFVNEYDYRRMTPNWSALEGNDSYHETITFIKYIQNHIHNLHLSYNI